jgi:hypothetical protein
VADVLNNTSNDPGPGEISIKISNSTFEKISSTNRFFSTKELKARGIVITVQEALFQNIDMQNGIMFEFKHNFRLVNFINCKINDNKGLFLEMIPKETKTL